MEEDTTSATQDVVTPAVQEVTALTIFQSRAQIEDAINALMPYCAYRPAITLDKIKKDGYFRFLDSKDITSTYRYSTDEQLDEQATFYKKTIYTRTSDGTEYVEHIMTNKGGIVASSHYRQSGFLKLYARNFGNMATDYYYYNEAGELVEISMTSGGSPCFKFFVEEGGVHALIMLNKLDNKHEVHLPQQISGRPVELAIGTLMEKAMAEYQKLNTVPGPHYENGKHCCSWNGYATGETVVNVAE